LKTLAAVLVETGKPLALGEIEIPALKPGQVLVEIAYSGACHTQVLETRGLRGEDRWVPHCLGHEGTGKVLETGPGVTKVKPDQQVIMSWLKGSGMEAGGTVYSWEGKNVNSGGVTTFARIAVASENRLMPLPDGLGMREGIMLGCALPTGMGAVINSGAAHPGESVAVFGVGGVGTCAVLGAVAAECAPIIAVDINPSKLELAVKSGATHIIDASTTDVVETIKEICPNGVDLTVEATGIPDVMAQAMAVVRNQGGRTVILGNAAEGKTLTVNPQYFNAGKSIIGSWGGDSQPDRDYPRFAEMMIKGRIDVNPIISSPYRLADINDALDDLEAGRIGRPLIDMSLN
jgi:S-(hydroxymethyl)glutathione dehydrogenase/alcohol dehydrogenase